MEKRKGKKKEPDKAPAPKIVYVAVCDQGNANFVTEDAEVMYDEFERDSDDTRIARYVFDGFVTIAVGVTVTDIK